MASIRLSDGWLDGFYVLFMSISVTSKQVEDDNEKLCAMEPCVPLVVLGFLLPARIKDC